MRWKAVWTSVLFFGISPAFAVGTKTVTVGIPTSQFNFVATAQLHNEWCWAASVQMVLNWYRIPVKQSDVVNRIYHKPVDEAASEDAIAVALSGTAYDRGGRKVFLHSERHHGLPPTSVLLNEMSGRRPMLITIHSTRTMLHAVVLTSVEYEQTQQGTQILAITYRDPNPTFRGRRAAGSIRVAGPDLAHFLRSISSYYLVTVRI